MSDWRSDAELRAEIRRQGHSPQPSPHAPRGRFTKWRGSAGYVTQRAWAGQQWQWSSQLAGQYSDDPLPAGEQYLLTDPNAVRGLSELSLAASTAASWHNSLTLRYPLGTGWSLEPKVGLDVGWRRIEGLSRRSRDPLATVPRMGGASLGVTLAHRHTRLNLDYQHPLLLPGVPRPSGFWRLELAFKL